ncbi:MAG: flavin-containing monooxygenase [Actinomycetota bacterium]
MNNQDLDLDVVVIGAGFGGMYALHALRERGLRTKAFESGDNVGGTWFWNRYPGARCDVESLDYQYSFSRKLVDGWTWSERYAPQPEILAYASWVADELDLRKDIIFETKVLEAIYDELNHSWDILTSDGQRTRARYLVSAGGSLSAASYADFPGIENFSGKVYHPGHWPAEGVDFAGKRVAVIGVGSSSVQLIPEVAKQADELVVFQRTPAYTVPARNRPLYDDEVINRRRNHEELTESTRRSHSGINFPMTGDTLLDMPEPKRTNLLEKNWKLGGNMFIAAFNDVHYDLEANGIMAEFVRNKLHNIVDDPEIARKLTPSSYPIGSKRIITDTNYWASFNRPNVKLVSVLEEPITDITENSITTRDHEYQIDIIIAATGYDSLTGSLTRIDIRGRDGMSLKDSWSSGVHTYLGLASAGFPNLFTITGPQSPSVLVNMFAAIEQHVEWIVNCIDYLTRSGFEEIEATAQAESMWNDQVEQAVQDTLYLKAKSWYNGSNIQGKPSQFLAYTGGLDEYRRRCDEAAEYGYRGFRVDGRELDATTLSKVSA